jgi:NifU-like protein involved in Fe-S cluster formation
MIDTENSLLVQEYYKHTTYHHLMTDAQYIYTIGNTICGDSIIVYLCIQDQKIVAYSYDGSPALITQAAAAFVGDYVIGESLYTILTRDADRVVNE